MSVLGKYPQKFKKQHKRRQFIRHVKPTPGLIPYTGEFAKYVTISVRHASLIPNKFIVFFRKIFRKFFKKRHVSCWVNLEPNKVISSKSKNSRMGKGVGSLVRVGFYCSPRTPMFVLSNLSLKRAKKVARFLTSRGSVPFVASEQL